MRQRRERRSPPGGSFYTRTHCTYTHTCIPTYVPYFSAAAPEGTDDALNFLPSLSHHPATIAAFVPPPSSAPRGTTTEPSPPSVPLDYGAAVCGRYYDRFDISDVALSDVLRDPADLPSFKSDSGANASFILLSAV